MQGFETKTFEKDKNYLVYESNEQKQMETYVSTWLASTQNKSFFQWKVYDTSKKTKMYTSVSNFISLQKFLNEKIDWRKLNQIIIQIAEGLITIQESILESCRVLLKQDLVFIEEKLEMKSYSIHMIYIPFKCEISELTYKNEHKNFFEHLIKIYLDLNKRISKEDEISLLNSCDGNYEEMISLLKKYSNRRNKTAKKRMITAKNFNWLKELHRNYPVLLLIIEFLILFSIYGIDKYFNGIPLAVLSIQVFLICVCVILQGTLLLLPNSPFFAFEKTNRETIETEDKEEVNNLDNVHFTPVSNLRRASITILNPQAVKQLEQSSWQMYQNEFLIGSDSKKADLYLSLKEEELFARICQRAGSFYLQALSPRQSIYLMDRMLYRYEDYLLPDECTIKVGEIHIRFRAYS